MVIRLPGIKDEDEFIGEYLPKRISLELSKYKHNNQLTKFDSYIRSNYNINVSAYYLLEMALRHLHVMKDINGYYLELDKRISFGGKPIEPIVRTIEEGNLSIRGCHLLHKIADSILQNYDAIKYYYDLSRVGGKKHGS